MTTTTPLDPIVSEFETEEQAAAYDAWFKAKVQEAMESNKPAIPHDEVVRRMEERVARLRRQAG